jgi:hypothetical protein
MLLTKGETIMSEQKHNNPESVPPHRQLLEMAEGYWVSQIVYAAAKLALADHLADGPKSAAELAPLTNTHPKSLYRLLRTLVSLDIVSVGANQRFALTTLGEALKSDAPGLARPGIMSLVSKRSWRAWEALPQAIETGQTGMEIAWGMPLFEYLTQHPEEAVYFSAISWPAKIVAIRLPLPPRTTFLPWPPSSMSVALRAIFWLRF